MIVFETSNTSISPGNLSLIVIVIVVSDLWALVVQFSKSFRLFSLKESMELLSCFTACNIKIRVIHMMLRIIDCMLVQHKLVVLSLVWVIWVPCWLTRDIIYIHFGVLIIIPELNRSDIVHTVSVRKFPVIVIKIWMIDLIKRA